jgi:hypothetical protein
MIKDSPKTLRGCDTFGKKKTSWVSGITSLQIGGDLEIMVI